MPVCDEQADVKAKHDRQKPCRNLQHRQRTHRIPFEPGFDGRIPDIK
jgi:hypothetical protein